MHSVHHIGIQNATLRYFNVYGPGCPDAGSYAPVIGLFFRQALKDETNLTITGDGLQRRDFCYIDDVLEANIKALEGLINKPETTTGQAFNVGYGGSYAILDVAKLVLASLRKEELAKDIDIVNIPARPAEIKETLADISKAKEILGWESKISLQEGIERVKPYYVEKYGHKLYNNRPYQRKGLRTFI